jgi:hypothetical protein
LDAVTFVCYRLETEKLKADGFILECSESTDALVAAGDVEEEDEDSDGEAQDLPSGLRNLPVYFYDDLNTN